MGNLGGAEILVILLVALIVLGPTKLPPAVRQIGKFVGEIRRLGQGFQQELREASKPLVETTETLRAADPRNAIPKSPTDTTNNKSDTTTTKSDTNNTDSNNADSDPISPESKSQPSVAAGPVSWGTAAAPSAAANAAATTTEEPSELSAPSESSVPSDSAAETGISEADISEVQHPQAEPPATNGSTGSPQSLQ